jgi:hypothetical protein
MKQLYHLCTVLHRIIPICVLFTFTSCLSQAMMKQSDYETIQIGTPVESLKDLVGAPYRIIREGDGSRTFQYIERIEIGPGAIEQRIYSLRVQNERIVGKKCSIDSQPFLSCFIQS